MATDGSHTSVWPAANMEELTTSLGDEFKASVLRRLRRLAETVDPDEIVQSSAYLQGMYNAAVYFGCMTETTARTFTRAVHEAGLERLTRLGFSIASKPAPEAVSRTLN